MMTLVVTTLKEDGGENQSDSNLASSEELTLRTKHV